MITDAEFWMEERRKISGGDGIFKAMIVLLHARQVRLDARTTTLDRVEYNLRCTGAERRDVAYGRVFSSEEKKHIEEVCKAAEKELKEVEKTPPEANKSLAITNMVPPRRVATISIRVLQQIMMFAVPVYALRYNVPAMSMSWNTSCFIDRPYKQLITFGAGQGVKVPQHLCGRGCVAGDGFFAILTDQDEVWASGGLRVSSSSVSGPTPLGREEVMTGIAGKTLMLVGHGQRLASVTRAFTVRPLSALSNPTRSIIPARHVRFLDLGYGEDYYMVGTDSVVYKTTASKRAVSTPRRVMPLCRTPVSRIASGTSFLLIIDQNGHLITLGRNKKGQLGNGEKQDAHRKPYLHKGLRHHYFVQVAAGDCHSIALTSSGIAYGAGSNESGQLGLGPVEKSVVVFTPIPLPCKCVSIAAGPVGSMFACEDGQILTCGLNDCMQLGLETPDKIIYRPTRVAMLQSGVESYTMDFGGFRFPDGRSVRQDLPSGAEKQQQSAPYGSGAATTGGGGDAASSTQGGSTLPPTGGADEISGSAAAAAISNEKKNNVHGSASGVPGAENGSSSPPPGVQVQTDQRYTSSDHTGGAVSIGGEITHEPTLINAGDPQLREPDHESPDSSPLHHSRHTKKAGPGGKEGKEDKAKCKCCSVM